MAEAESKICASCGRVMLWRKKWERSWAEVRHCSSRCRSRGVRAVDIQLEEAIQELLAIRASGATICPSEAARSVAGEEWRPLMEPARAAARRLQANGRAVILQGGRPVDPSTAKGPIRIRLT
ncbi:MAG: DUF2256 and DUF3253 domain-containing protein [Microthrixaceae bacterium]